MAEVTVRTPLGDMPAYVATPSAGGPWPGIVIVHDFTGMSHDLRNQAKWLALNGYLAIAPDLYDWGSRLGCLRTIMRDIGAQQGRTFHDIDAARRWLVDHDECTGVSPVPPGHSVNARLSGRSNAQAPPVVAPPSSLTRTSPTSYLRCPHAAMNQRSNGAGEGPARVVRCGVGPPTPI